MTFADLLATPSDTDVAWKVATTLLPLDGDDTAFAVVMRSLSSSLVLIATAYLAYAILSLIVQAARTGEPVPEKSSSVFAMLRVVLGFGMLIPLGSLSAVHYVLRDFVVAPGIQIANAGASAAVGFTLKDGHPLSPVSASGRDLVLAVAESEVCARTYATAREWRVIEGEGAARLPDPGGSPIVSPAEESWWPWGEDQPERTAGYAWSWGPACGSLTLTTAEGFAKGEFGEARRQAVATVIGAVRAMPFAEKLADAVKTASDAGAHLTGPDIETVYQSRGLLRAQVESALREAGNRYDRGLSEIAASLSTGDDTGLREEVVRDVSERGFLALGSYYRVLAHSSLAASEAVAERPVRTAPDPASWEGLAGPVGTALALIDSQLRRESVATTLASGEALTGEAAGAGNVFATLLGSVTTPVADFLTGYEGFRPDPVGDLMTLGNRLMVGGQVAFATALAAYGGSAFALGAGQGLLDFVMVPGWTLIGLAWLGGAIMVYVLPLVPFLFMFFAFSAWALEVLVAAIAVVAWAFAHVRIDEPDFVGKAQLQGYASLLISVMLRPVVTVAGFVAAHMMTVTLLNVFLSSYNLAFNAGQVGFTLGATGVVVSVGVMVYVQWHLVLWSYRMILTAPERVGQFLGFSVPSWGEGEAGSTVIGGVVGGHRHLPKMGGAGGKGKDKPGDDKAGAKAGTPLRATGNAKKPDASAA
ncbi:MULTISPECIES: DotA/TraY family protein [Aureimonas]|uniref:Conjugal transfer/type IV secretion protein DotA/TraY n=1 Tax=Aureimonas pseudogalii TaxID=1744844 RepID=A0A7W6H6W3_9HYPH|nr:MULTISPECIES: DotA/TraY family protein [Aureimonas]MBB3999714.1 conjugal transfer/type IV secretion protein DotA/TraY [Aureimonas pseudogalii]